MNEKEKWEKVIRGLECHLGNDKNHYDCDNCQYGPMNDECDAKLVADALALLKVQEPKYPIKKQSKHGWSSYCPMCGIILNEMDRPKYCSECGQAVKWV